MIYIFIFYICCFVILLFRTQVLVGLEGCSGGIELQQISGIPLSLSSNQNHQNAGAPHTALCHALYTTVAGRFGALAKVLFAHYILVPPNCRTLQWNPCRLLHPTPRIVLSVSWYVTKTPHHWYMNHLYHTMH